MVIWVLVIIEMLVEHLIQVMLLFCFVLFRFFFLKIKFEDVFLNNILKQFQLVYQPLILEDQFLI